MATPQMNESWYQIRERIRHTWKDLDLSDKEMKAGRGKMREMVRMIHEETGEPRSAVRNKLSALI